MQNGNPAPRRDASRGVRGHPHHDFQWPRPHPRVPGGALRVLCFVAVTCSDTPIAGVFLSRLGRPLQVHSEGEGRWPLRVSALSAPRPTQVPPRAACSSVAGGTGETGESAPSSLVSDFSCEEPPAPGLAGGRRCPALLTGGGVCRGGGPAQDQPSSPSLQPRGAWELKLPAQERSGSMSCVCL